MLAVYRRQNYRRIELHDGAQSAELGVFRRDGTIRWVHWGGFVDQARAKLLPGAVPVRVAIDGFCTNYDAPQRHWVDLPAGSSVQGCLVGSEVFLVIVPSVRILQPKALAANEAP